MTFAPFVHLRVRSAYSLAEGAIKLDKLASLAQSMRMPAVAVTDRDNLFGALEFAQYAASAGVQPIIGCDLAIRREEEGGIAGASKAPQADWLALLAQTERGYLNLLRLSEANTLLARSALPVAEVAALLGYASATHFSTAFRQVYGCSPRQVRQRNEE